nr:MAG TPA: hypothetical protein [Caudoviricetes sp.]
MSDGIKIPSLLCLVFYRASFKLYSIYLKRKLTS